MQYIRSYAKISVRDLEPGTKFTRSVYLDKDTVFVGSDQPITQQDLDRLNQFGISFVLTDGGKSHPCRI